MSSVGGRLGHLRPRGGSKKEGKVGPLVCFPWGPSGLHGRVPVPSCLPVHPSGPLSFPHPLPPGSHTHQFPFCFRMPPTPRASHPNTDRLPLPLATFSFASLSGSWPPFMSPFGSVSLGPLSPFWLSTCVSPSLPASLCGASVSEALSLLCLSAISVSVRLSVSSCLSLVSLWLSVSLCDLSLVLCFPPPLPAPPSPHPELSLGNRKFGGSERYWEARLLPPPRDNAGGGAWGWMGVGEPRIPCAFLVPSVWHTQRQRNYVPFSGLSAPFCGLGPMNELPPRLGARVHQAT